MPPVYRQAQIQATGVVVLNHNLDNLVVYASTNGSAVRPLRASVLQFISFPPSLWRWDIDSKYDMHGCCMHRLQLVFLWKYLQNDDPEHDRCWTAS